VNIFLLLARGLAVVFGKEQGLRANVDRAWYAFGWVADIRGKVFAQTGRDVDDRVGVVVDDRDGGYFVVVIL
jgi:hypothetical protein